MAKCWSEKNEYDSRYVLKGSEKKCWFKCDDCTHEFNVILYSIKNDKHCPFCTNQTLCKNDGCVECFNKSCGSNPKLLVEWSTLNEKTPRQTFLQSNVKVKFNCSICNHLYETTPASYFRNNGSCPYCGNQRLCDEEKCIICFNKSFQTHPMAKSWSSKNILSPRMVFKNSEKKFWFYCKDCNHEFNGMVSSITNDKYCPYCNNQYLCKNDSCKFCFKKSCASNNNMLNRWSHLNVTSPRELFLHSRNKITLNCLICKHENQTSPMNYSKHDGFCAYCANKKLCDKEDCVVCFNKSFASHPRIESFSPKNNINPRMIFKGSATKFIFSCNVCNMEYKSVMYSILAGQGCPFCKNKTESKILSFLKENYSDLQSQVRFDWCRFSKTNSIMPVDFVLCNNKIIIELDGKQHFNQVKNWESPEIIQERDIEKIYNCINKSHSIIRIYQPDVWKDVCNWKEVLKNEIKILIDSLSPMLVCISSTDSYNSHINKLNKNINYKYLNPVICS
jgi:very-short-patch-repair endonuclease/ribosomal protein L31